MEKIKDKSLLSKTLISESFIEKIILLFVTVLLSGLLIPYVTNEIQKTKSKNEIILQAQSKLLDDVSKTLLTYETLLADISWFKTPEAYDTVMYLKAFEKYTDRAVDLLADWRLQSVKARTLVNTKCCLLYRGDNACNDHKFIAIIILCRMQRFIFPGCQFINDL